MNIYLDSAATCLIHPNVKKIIIKEFEEWANPSSIHSLGYKNKEKLENLRNEAKKILNISNNYELIFTSCATESNNIILNSTNLPILVSNFEHSSIKNFPNIEIFNIFDLNELEEKLKKKQYLVSCMLINHETGMIMPINEISNLIEKYNSKLHVDASQAKNINLENCNFNYITLSAHKIGGPVGVGAIITKHTLKTFLHGGHQEFNIRSGTQNIPLIAGFVESLKINHDYSKLNEKLKELIPKENFLENYVVQKFCNHIICLILKYPGSELITFMDLNNIAISYGSACNSNTSGAMEGINVLKEFNNLKLIPENAVRISFGWNNTESEIIKFAQIFNSFNLK